MFQPEKIKSDLSAEATRNGKNLDLVEINALIASLKRLKPEIFRHIVGMVRAILKDVK